MLDADYRGIRYKRYAVIKRPVFRLSGSFRPFIMVDYRQAKPGEWVIRDTDGGFDRDQAAQKVDQHHRAVTGGFPRNNKGEITQLEPLIPQAFIIIEPWTPEWTEHIEI